MTLALLDRYLLGAAGALAVLIAWRRREHRPVAVFLAGQAFVQLALRLSWRPYLRAAVAAAGGDLDAGIRPTLPLDGWGRVVGVADVAAFLAWPAGLAALALWCFGALRSVRERVWTPDHLNDWVREPTGRMILASPLGWFVTLVAWAGAVLGVAFTYPDHRDLYPRIYTGAMLAAVIVSAAAMVGWLVRRYRDREGISPTALCVASIVVIEAGAMAGAHYWGLWAAYDLDRIMTAVMYVWLLVVQTGMMWRRRDDA